MNWFKHERYIYCTQIGVILIDFIIISQGKTLLVYIFQFNPFQFEDVKSFSLPTCQPTVLDLSPKYYYATKIVYIPSFIGLDFRRRKLQIQRTKTSSFKFALKYKGVFSVEI